MPSTNSRSPIGPTVGSETPTSTHGSVPYERDPTPCRRTAARRAQRRADLDPSVRRTRRAGAARPAYAQPRVLRPIRAVERGDPDDARRATGAAGLGTEGLGRR